MTISRIGTFAAHQSILRDTNETQRRLFDVQTQISSGFKTQNFEGLHGQVENFTALEDKMKKAQNYLDNNNLVVSRLNQTGVALDQITQTADDLKNLLVRRRSVGGDISFTQQMEAFKKLLSSQLNSSVEGRFLFGGTRTDIQPVIDDPLPNPNTVGVPDDSYYAGSKEDLAVRAQDNFEITYNVRADDQSFQQIFAGIFLGQQGNDENNDDKIAQAEDLVKQGLQGVIALRARVNANTVSINEINDRHDSLRLYWKGVTESIVKTNLLDASTQVAVDQAVLTASFQAFARISSLRLVDYLR